MQEIDYAQAALSFLLVLGLIGLLAFALRRFRGAQPFLSNMQGEGRIRVLETHYLDARRRLVLIRRDEVEHLLLLADGRETVVESNIQNKQGAHG